MDESGVNGKYRDEISNDFRHGKRPQGDSNAKTVEALSILGAGKPHGSPLGYKGRPAHDTMTYAEDTN